jgi:hypothetical protein
VLTAVNRVGGAEPEDGVTEYDCVAAPVPAVLMAATLAKYGVPLARLLKLTGDETTVMLETTLLCLLYKLTM